MVKVIVGWVCILALAVGAAEAAVVCKKKSGALVVRDECRKKESPVALSEFGAVGPQGPAGADGAQGPIGPSNGYATSSSSAVALLEDGTSVTLMSIDVPDGSYVATAHIQGVTLTDPDGPPGNNYRYDCTLRGGDTTIDFWQARVGTTSGVESYLTFTGGFTGSGPIELVCSAGNDHPLRVDGGSMTAVKVGSLN